MAQESKGAVNASLISLEGKQDKTARNKYYYLQSLGSSFEDYNSQKSPGHVTLGAVVQKVNFPTSAYVSSHFRSPEQKYLVSGQSSLWRMINETP